MNLSPFAWTLTLCLLFQSCKLRTAPATAPGKNFPPDFDTMKLRQATESPGEQTLLRIMVGHRLRPNGYFFGPPGVLPNGEVFMDVLKQSPTYNKEGYVKIFYRYLEDSMHLSGPWPISKVDTFTFQFGAKD